MSSYSDRCESSERSLARCGRRSAIGGAFGIVILVASSSQDGLGKDALQGLRNPHWRGDDVLGALEGVMGDAPPYLRSYAGWLAHTRARLTRHGSPGVRLWSRFGLLAQLGERQTEEV